MSTSSGGTKFKFEFEWRIALFTVLMLPTLIVLGFWQLQRSDEKAAIAAQFEQRRQQAPLSLTQAANMSADELSYLPVALSGSFVEPLNFLLDNRVRNGRFGYELISVFQLNDSNRTVLVNRGWLPGDAARLSLPSIPLAEGLLTLSGHVYVAPGKQYQLAEQALENNWPKRIQALELDELRETLPAAQAQVLFPYTVRLDAEAPGALATDWQIINVSPAKHTGYAVQWFSMAAALFILYVVRSSNIWHWLRRKKDP